MVVRGKRGEIVCQKDGIYSAQPMIYQQAVLDAYVDGYHPVLGLWIVGDEPAGMGIREDKDLVTTDTSTFIPHVIKD